MNIEKNLSKLLSQGYTYFLDKIELKILKGKLKHTFYNIYLPYKDSEKSIIYKKNIPEVSIFEIKTKEKLKHQEIMGSLFSLGINKDMFGDIIIDNNKYYFYVFSSIENYIILNLEKIGKYKIYLEKKNIEEFKNYERRYEEITLISSSERIDSIISGLININREKVREKIKNKEVILNYEIVNNNSKVLRKDDIFSVKRYGKYKYYGVIKNTKKNNYIIKIYKYI